MTLISQIMTHKEQKKLIEMQAETDKLFQQCKALGKNFFEFPDWIRNHIESSLTKYADFKQSRLARIFQRGKTKLLERQEEKKLRASQIQPDKTRKK